MTNSPTNTIPNTTSRVNHFTGLARRRRKFSLLPANGDGSTLTLDFTTGVLDPRLTFTRGSNATFINSSGLVEWAAANNFTNSTFSGSSGTTVPNWSFSVPSGAATVSLSGTALTITCTTATRARVVQSIGTGTGLQVTTQVRVTARSMAFPLNEVLAYSVNGSSGDQYKVNGVNQISSYTGWSVGDVISLTCIPTSGAAAQAVIGIGASAAQPAGQSITITEVQAEPGTSARTVVSTGTSGSYYAPRFDYDPTTLAPRGLLIEGTATNLLQQSAAVRTSPWSTANLTTAGASITAPDGTANGVELVWTNTTAIGLGYTFQEVAVAASTAYTMSVYLKPKGVNVNTALYIQARASTTSLGYMTVSFVHTSGNMGAVANGPFTSTSATSTNVGNGWYRVTVTGTSPATADNIRFFIVNANLGNGTDGVYAWGAQLEAGSGASSYIPTGASTVQRLADKMSMVDISTMAWNQTQGTFLLHMDVAAETNTSAFPAMMGMYTATPVRVVRFLLNNSSGTNPRIGCDTWTAAPAQILTSLIARSSAPTAFKYAAALSNTGQALSHVVNNGSVTTTTGTGTLQTPTRMLWHQDPSAADTEYFPVHIRTVKYWPTNLPDATLKAITT